MADMTVSLTHGLKIGESVFKNAVVREATAGDYLECQEQSEKIVLVPGAGPNSPPEPMFISSPSLMSSLMLCRQVKSINEHSGPLTLDELKSLHPEDLNLLMDATETLLSPTISSLSSEVSVRGRSDSSGKTQ